MQSSYKIIKDTVIGESAVVSPPILDSLYKKAALKYAEKDGSEPEDIQEVILKEAYSKSDAIIRKANEESKALLDNAKKSAEELKSKASEDGYQEGYKHGYKEGYNYGINEAGKEAELIKHEAESIRSGAKEFLGNCHEESRKYFRDCEKEIIKLATDMARQIINTELTINPEAIYKIAEKLVSKATDKKQIMIRVNPHDFNIVKNRKEELAIYVEDSNNIIIIADPGTAQGNLRAETSSGFLDASVETQLNMILSRMLGD
jgi:flagellar assembly protein FliH